MYCTPTATTSRTSKVNLLFSNTGNILIYFCKHCYSALVHFNLAKKEGPVKHKRPEERLVTDQQLNSRMDPRQTNLLNKFA